MIYASRCLRIERHSQLVIDWSSSGAPHWGTFGFYPVHGPDGARLEWGSGVLPRFGPSNSDAWTNTRESFCIIILEIVFSAQIKYVKFCCRGTVVLRRAAVVLLSPPVDSA